MGMDLSSAIQFPPAAHGEGWLDTWRGDVLAAAWGLAESTVFFFLPDVFITVSASRSPKRALRHSAWATLGAAAGGTTLFLFASVHPEPARRLVEHVPFVTGPMFARAGEGLQTSGPWSMLRGAFTGLPYKVFAVLAPRHKTVLEFSLITFPARGSRFLVSWVIASLGGRLFKSRTRQPTRWIAATLVVALVSIYSIYWTRVIQTAHRAPTPPSVPMPSP